MKQILYKILLGLLIISIIAGFIWAITFYMEIVFISTAIIGICVLAYYIGNEILRDEE